MERIKIEHIKEMAGVKGTPDMIKTSSGKMADEHSQMENRAEIISNFANAGNSTKCELCKDLELQLSCVLNELSSVRLIVDLLSKEQNRVQ
jgi:hypothetical protein